MFHLRILAVLAVLIVAMPAGAAELNGTYLEVRNCDVWTGPCYANAEGNLIGMNAAMVWNIDSGSVDGVNIDGLTVIAVIQATDTLGTRQNGAAKAVLVVDSKATESQRQALVKLAQRQGGDLVANIAAVRTSEIKFNVCHCPGESCAEVDAGIVKVKTRCIDEKHDMHCGNETAFYPPLIGGVKCVPAVADHSFSGTGLASTWSEGERRGAYVGTFTTSRWLAH